MSKRSAFTTITPLPQGIGRRDVLEMLHNYEEMIDLNPAIRERHLISPPPHAEKDELDCIWYLLTEKKSSYFPAGLANGDVSNPCAFNDLSNGLQTHFYGPAGLDIRQKWTLNGRLPGEPAQPVEMGIGAPATGLYLRQDVEMRCSVVTASSVRRTLKKSHATLIERLRTKTQRATPGKYDHHHRRTESETASITSHHVPSLSTGSTTSQESKDSKASRKSRRLSWTSRWESPAPSASVAASTSNGSGNSPWFRAPRSGNTSRPSSMFFGSKSTTRLPEMVSDTAGSTVGGLSYEQLSGPSRAGSFPDSLSGSISQTPLSMYGERPFTSYNPSPSYAPSTPSTSGSSEDAEQNYTVAPPARAPPVPPPALVRPSNPATLEEPKQHQHQQQRTCPSPNRAPPPPPPPPTASPIVSPVTPESDPRLLPEPLRFPYRLDQAPASVPQKTPATTGGGPALAAGELLDLLLHEHPDYPHMSPYSNDERANPLVGQHGWSGWTAAPRCGSGDAMFTPGRPELAGPISAGWN